ncbi:MAG: enoyl-CoA hydratase/isomerase family protein [Nitrososphaeraceae archaeon]|nr:enoyl-CoA hydratase/isomerase family protein [Nitrososphaeraceae archaeon]MBV9668010.1 enoyl-CoA hydratase/isomerase family protein [Nitrososphaeraceae archaeon]
MKYILLDLQAKDEGIAIIKINRPEVLNALNIETMSELSTAIDIVNADNNIKVVIITGTGQKSFCAGADIRYVVNIDPIEAEKYATFIHGLLNKIENLEKPVIAAVNGYALGGGCELALACDIRIASSNAKIGQTEVTVGIPPGWGGTQRLLRIVGPSKTKELIYTGKMITAEEAERIGFVNRVVRLSAEEYGRLLGEQTSINTVTTTRPPSTGSQEEQQQQDEKQRANQLAKILNKKLINECISMAKEIAKNSFTAVKTSKMLINRGMDVDINTGLQLEVYGWALCFAHEDRQKMMSSFLNKAKEK